MQEFEGMGKGRGAKVEGVPAALTKTDVFFKLAEIPGGLDYENTSYCINDRYVECGYVFCGDGNDRSD
jgi:hypothetical protein